MFEAIAVLINVLLKFILLALPLMIFSYILFGVNEIFIKTARLFSFIATNINKLNGKIVDLLDKINQNKP